METQDYQSGDIEMFFFSQLVTHLQEQKRARDRNKYKVIISKKSQAAVLQYGIGNCHVLHVQYIIMDLEFFSFFC